MARFCLAVICLIASHVMTARSYAVPRDNPIAAFEGCGKPLPTGQTLGGVSNVTITSNGTERRFLVFVPPRYNPFIPTPLILSYHGGTRTAESQLALDQLTNPEFNTESMVIYPQGINNVWQGVPNVTVNDVQFTTDILDAAQRTYCLNPSRITATGKSDGGGFCNVLACDAALSQRIAAFAPVSGAYYIDTLPCSPASVAIPCSPGREDVPLLAFHGGNDTTIAYAGGQRKNECLPSIPHWIREWARRDGLGVGNRTVPVAQQTVRYEFGAGLGFGFGEEGLGLVGLVYESDIGHDWPSTAPNSDNTQAGHHVASYNATPIILDFFAAHPLNVLETFEEVF